MARPYICLLVALIMRLLANTVALSIEDLNSFMNPCGSLPRKATTERQHEATKYCKDVLDEHVNSKSTILRFEQKRCRGLRDAMCSPRSKWTYFMVGGPKHRCTVSIQLNDVISAVLCRTHIRVDLAYCLKVTKWEETKEFTAAYALQGKRPSMEDRFVIHENAAFGLSIFAVFDGHGGQFTVNYAKTTLVPTLVEKIMKLRRYASDQLPKTGSSSSLNRNDALLKRNSSGSPSRHHGLSAYFTTEGAIDYKKVLHDVILATDQAILTEARQRYSEYSGSTALVALIDGSTLYVANVGDSRGVMCDSEGKTVALSFDQKPDMVEEKTRIIAAGGQVVPAPLGDKKTLRVNGSLAMSRALGNLHLKLTNALIANPVVFAFDLSEYKPEFIILATDGVWDKFTNEAAVNLVRKTLKEQHFGAKSLTNAAYYAGSSDNITSMVINLNSVNW